MADTKTEAPKEKPKTLKQWLESAAEQIAAVSPPNVKPERVIRMALLAAHKNPRITECTPDSVVFSVIQIASWGLEIGRTAHLVPFKNTRNNTYTCTPMIDVKGIAQAMIQSGEVMSIDARVVRDGDVFKVIYGTEPTIIHEPVIGSTTEITAFYAVFVLPNGDRKFEVMSKAEVDKVRAGSRSKDDGPWVSWYDEMGKKTVVKRGSKLIPMTERVHDLIEADNREYAESTATGTTKAPATRGKSSRLAALGAPSPNPLEQFDESKRTPIGDEVQQSGGGQQS